MKRYRFFIENANGTRGTFLVYDETIAGAVIQARGRTAPVQAKIMGWTEESN